MSSTDPQPSTFTQETQVSILGSISIPTGILDAVLSGYTDPLCVYDRAGRHLYASPASARLLGIRQGDMIGKTNREIGIAPPVCDFMDQTLNVVFTERRAINTDVVYPTIDGIREYEAACSPIYAANGKIEAALSVLRDVTERNQAQRAYRKQAMRYQQLLETSLEGILSIDAQDTIIYVNPCMEQMLGYGASELTGRTVYDILFPEDIDMARERRRERREGHQEQYEVRLRNKENQEVWALVCVSVVWEEAQYAGTFAMFIDITNRKHIEQEHERNLAEIQILNARLRRAMSDTFDLVRNNLQIINALAEMQDEDGNGTVPIRAMRRIKQHVGTLADVHYVLTKNAREYGEGQTISIKSLLEKLRPVLQSMAGDRVLRLSVDDVILPNRTGTAIAMITNELVDNAVQHGAGEIEITFRTGETEATLSVRDHGPGFPSDFAPTEYEGTGIELVQSLAGWTLRGRACYTSHPNGGGLVTVTFRITE